MRSLIAIAAAVVTVGMLSAGPLAASSPGADLPTDDVVAQQVARLLLVDTLAADEDRWERDRLETFVDGLETERTDALDIEVVEDRSGPALAVTIDALGDDVEEVCVVGDAEGQPTSAGRPCRG